MGNQNGKLMTKNKTPAQGEEGKTNKFEAGKRLFGRQRQNWQNSKQRAIT